MEYNFADVIREREKIHSKYARGCGCDSGCPLGAWNNEYDEPCGIFIYNHPEEYAKAVMDWAEAHKPKTNGEVAIELLEEKFGIKISTTFSRCDFLQCDANAGECEDCPYNNFWDKEYKGE